MDLSAFQCQRSSSSILLVGWSAERASSSERQDCGSTGFIVALAVNLDMRPAR